MTSPKVIIVTGASRGIGLAIAQHIIAHKAHKVVLTARTVDALHKLQSDSPDLVEILSLDMGRAGAGKDLIDRTIQRFGRLDGIVVNHGVLDPVNKVADSSVDTWKKAFDINVFSALELVQAGIPHLRQSNGKIIFTSSGAAVGAYTGWGAYGAAKAALNHLTMTLAVEEPNIVSVAIRPGVVDTEMQREIRETHSSTMVSQDWQKFVELKSSGGLLRPDQPGNVIAKLVLDAPATLSGKFLSWNDSKLEAFQERGE